MSKRALYYKTLIINIIISFLLAEALIYLFKINNNVILTMILTAINCYCLSKYKEIKHNNKVVVSIFSLLISIVLSLQRKVTFTGEVHSNYLENTFDNFCLTDILRISILFVILYLVFSNVFNLFKNNKYSVIEKERELDYDEKFKYWLKSSFLFFIPFFIFLVIEYPGYITPDSIASIYQGIDRIPLTNHHPVLYTELVGFIMRVGRFFHSYNFGLFLYSLFQLTIMSAILGYFLLWLRKHKVKYIFIIFTFLYYISNTLFASYAITMWKDPLFGSFLLLLSLYLYDIVKNNGEELQNSVGITKFILLVLLIAFLRNNGIYIVIGLFVVLVFVFKKELLSFHITYLITIIAILLIQGPLYSRLGIVSPSVESFAVPLQQVARTITYNGNISDENKEFLNEILPLEKWKEVYEPLSVDPIKWDEEFNEEYFTDNKIKFLKVWAQILPGNYSTYVKAYLLDTYGFWSIGEQIEYGLTGSGMVSNYLDLRHEDVIKNITGFSIEKYLPDPYFIGSGTLLWLTVLSCALLIILKKSKTIIALLPSLFSIITILIATPVAFSLRYVFMVALALPFILLLPFIEKNN